MPAVRVAFCITDLDIGGAEVCMVELATRLDRGRFTPVVYCLGPQPTDPQASCVPRLEAAGIEVRCLDGCGFSSAPRALARLTTLLRRQEPHLLQTFLFHANFLGRIAARRAGVPKVVCGIRVAERHSRWHLWLDRWTARLVDRYVCVSEAVTRFSMEKAGLPADKLVVISNGIDVRQYPGQSPADLAQFGIPAGSRVVTYIGRLEPQKGLRWLIETAPEWLSPSPDAHLLLAGKGPERECLEDQSRKSPVGPRIHFAGWRSDVPAILAASRLLVLPSRWEGMPNVVLQAMASGLPVVATDVEGVRELLGDQADAQTVPYGDSHSLADRLVNLLSNPQEAAELGRQNRRRAESAFTLEGMVAAYQQLWEELARP